MSCSVSPECIDFFSNLHSEEPLYQVPLSFWLHKVLGAQNVSLAPWTLHLGCESLRSRVALCSFIRHSGSSRTPSLLESVPNTLSSCPLSVFGLSASFLLASCFYLRGKETGPQLTVLGAIPGSALAVLGTICRFED